MMIPTFGTTLGRMPSRSNCTPATCPDTRTDDLTDDLTDDRGTR